MPSSLPAQSSPLSPVSSHSANTTPPTQSSQGPPAKLPRLMKEVDIGLFTNEKSRGVAVSDADKYNLIVSHPVPSP